MSNPQEVVPAVSGSAALTAPAGSSLNVNMQMSDVVTVLQVKTEEVLGQRIEKFDTTIHRQVREVQAISGRIEALRDKASKTDSKNTVAVLRKALLAAGLKGTVGSPSIDLEDGTLEVKVTVRLSKAAGLDALTAEHARVNGKLQQNQARRAQLIARKNDPDSIRRHLSAALTHEKMAQVPEIRDLVKQAEERLAGGMLKLPDVLEE